jgi:GT2 family glycosyltransferase
MRDQPLVSVIVVNWNGARHLRIALPSLREQSHASIEILVVDNGSRDESASVVAEVGGTWIGLGENRGLAPACNQGAWRASGEYLIFVNNDMRFASDFVEQLVRPLIQKENAFATDARALDWEGTKEVHLATRLSRQSGLDSYRRPGMLPLLQISQEQASRPTMALHACSAAMAVRSIMFKMLGGFDERLPMSWEDIEICWRAWLRGWPTYFVPAAVCWHRVGASITDNSDGAGAKLRGIVGGRLLFATKCLPAMHVLNTWTIALLGIGRSITNGRVGEAAAKARVVLEHALLIPKLLRERHRIYSAASTTPSVQLEHLLELRDQEDIGESTVSGNAAPRGAQ